METTKDFIINTIDWKLIHNTNSYPDSIRTDFMFESSILLGKITESVIDSKTKVLLTVGVTSLQMLEEFVQGACYFCLQGDLVEFQRICRTMRGYTP